LLTYIILYIVETKLFCPNLSKFNILKDTKRLFKTIWILSFNFAFKHNNQKFNGQAFQDFVESYAVVMGLNWRLILVVAVLHEIAVLKDDGI